MSNNKRKLSKTVLMMKFMNKTRIQQEQHDDENENIDVLTDQRIKGERHSFFIIEKNWEIIENLKCSRLNYGMSSKKDFSNVQTERTENNYDERDYKEPKKKQIRLVATKQD
ncbi:unnamed protein product [Chironomus riparius]|uniref:Uncharacterized protein n=1 Tax=Chironomus riparius TaxID=315576 RepID=A0A9N9RSC8_9DIPT|nr:unnamed protein product [Chironomus riparius]